VAVLAKMLKERIVIENIKLIITEEYKSSFIRLLTSRSSIQSLKVESAGQETMERNTQPTTSETPSTSVSRRIMNCLIDTTERCCGSDKARRT